MKAKPLKGNITSSKKVEKEVMRVNDLFWKAYAKRDIDLRFSLCSDDVTFIGSGLHERATNKTEYKQINKAGVKQFPHAFKIKFLWTHLTMIKENVACVESEVVWSQVINKKVSKELLRNTTLLKCEKNKWLVTHVHGSVPDYRLKEGNYMTNEQTIIRNKELERQVFERTRDLKMTLEEIKLKNKELEIESSLEKVRTIAMGMREPSDMLDVCKTISLQLQSLGIKEIRNVQTAIIYASKSIYINYEYYAKYKKQLITEVDFRSHYYQKLFVNKMLKGSGEIFTKTLKGKKVKDWYDYQKTTNQFADGYLRKAKSLSYYWFSLGPLALGISTYFPLRQEQLNLFKRFRNVFELAYQRYLDIEKAEAQAREAQVQLALERVRARSLAMHNTSELQEVVNILAQQLFNMNLDINGGVWIAINDQADQDLQLWASGGMADYVQKVNVPFFNSTIFIELRDAIRRKNNFFTEKRSDKEKIRFFKHLFNYPPWNSLSPQRKKELLSRKGGYTRSVAISNLTSISITNHNGKKFSDDDNEILKRFGNVFEQSYIRFLDLQKAEEQAREAQIEAALERVRSVAMTMMKSGELLNVCESVFNQLHTLGFNEDDLRNSQIVINNDVKGVYYGYQYSDYIGGEIAEVPYDMHPIIKMLNDKLRQSSEAFVDIKISGSDLEDWKVFVRSFPQKPDEKLNKATELHYYFYSVGIGALGISSFQSLSEEKLSILQRLRNVFNLSYQRYLDLAQAEVQAREAKIEAALERVRSKAMAMHSPNDLSETVNVFFKELKTLGIIPIRCGVGQIDGATRTTSLTTTTSSQQGDSFQVIGKIKQSGHPVLDGIFDHWKLQKEYYPVLEGENIKDYYNVMNAQIGYPEYPEGVTQYGNCFYFKEGFVFAWTENKLSEDELQIFRRFTSVLSLTYRRYLDLKEAEVRAFEAISQASLDRVRAEIASMRTSEDLNRITPIIWRELKNLDVPFFRCGVYIIDETHGKVRVYLTTPDGKSLVVLHLSFDSNEITNNTVEHWRKNLVYKEHWNKEEFIKWTNSMIAIGQVQNAETYQGASKPPETLHLHFIPFAQGMLYVGDINPLTDEKLELVKTLAEAFSIAYARYEDFKNLEGAKNKIEITLTELKSAQAQLVQAEKLASLGQLTAGIAHEIKNPLNFVNNFSEISSELLDEMKIELQNENKDEAIAIADDIKQNLEKINQHGKRADSIVKGMLLHSRGSAGEKSPTNMNDLLDQYLNLAYHGMRAQDKEFNITIQKDFDQTLEKINCVPQDISRVFLNVINNGFYAANEKKKKIENNFVPILKVSTKNLPDKVEIKIRDNGNGIPQTIKSNIFNPFFTTKPTGEGTGLGLSLSYDIITKAHNGEIIFDTKENEFTEFTITIPKS